MLADPTFALFCYRVVSQTKRRKKARKAKLIIILVKRDKKKKTRLPGNLQMDDAFFRRGIKLFLVASLILPFKIHIFTPPIPGISPGTSRLENIHIFPRFGILCILKGDGYKIISKRKYIWYQRQPSFAIKK